ncbi:hypothetical protein CRG98_028511 [Punica granatum]|uniref:G-patch domain-containing protein n=1 Tax=Punica granatum TaxID=22663 RepID=A0A2I0J4C4_PUNGR|nr:hypothetical protein CRG98_028511 [Punica granatum]
MNAMGITRSRCVYQGSEPGDKEKALAAAFLSIPKAAPLPAKKVTDQEAEAFMKVIKVSEYKVVEQMGKSPVHISLLALLLSSEPHRDALLKVLIAAQVPKETAPDRIEETVNSIFSNQISFAEDELPYEVMIDNGSALNVCPVSTLKQMNVDMSRIRASKTTVRAFDGSRREVNGEIDLLIDVGPCSFSVTFQILEIPNAFSLLLGRPWIHAAGAVPSSLHQKLKFFIEDYGEVGPSQADRMIRKGLLKSDYVPETGLRARAQGIPQPIEVEEYRNRRGLGFRPSFHEIVQALRGKHLHRLTAHYGKLSKGISVPPLLQFFPASPQIMGGTSDSPSTELDDSSSKTVEAFLALPGIYAVTEETSYEHLFLKQFAFISRLQSNPNHECNDSNSSETHLGKSLPIYFGEGLDEDGHVPTIEESLHRLENHQLTSVEPTEEVNIGTTEEPRTLRIGTGLEPAQRARMIDFLTEYQEVFAWSYADMPGLDPTIVKHFLPLDTEREVIKQVDVGFLEVCNYSEWVANIVPVEKKNGKVRVCIDNQDLNRASPEDNFPLPHIDVLVDNTTRHTQFFFMDGFYGCNQIQMAEEDKVKTTFITMWGMFCYKVMTFDLQNAGATYQRVYGPECGFLSRPTLRGLGVSTFPWGHVTDTREKESPLIILRPEGKSVFGGSCYMRAYIPHTLSVL